MKIENLKLKNFTVFEDVSLDFCGGINVLVGANGTGKSHVLKVLYGMQKGCNSGVSDLTTTGLDAVTRGPESAAGLIAVFAGHAGLSSLIRRDSNSELFVLEITSDLRSGESRVVLSFGKDGSGRCSDLRSGTGTRCLFLPPREFLAAYEGFIAAFTNREQSFDVTYFDLCVALSASPLKGEAAKWGRDVSLKLEEVLGAPVRLSDGRFYVGDDEAQLVAEGHRKIAMIVQLLRNGGITKGCTLYWDEPESGLNPKLVKEIADLLIVLAESGVQVFIASHDYLLTSELSLRTEYRTTTAETRFFCLSRASQSDPVSVESGEVLADLSSNPILQEFAAHYDREQRLFCREPVAATVGTGAVE